MIAFLLVAGLLGASEVQTVNIVQWDANSLPKIFQRSDQLPLTDDEVARLSKAGFEPHHLVKLLEERRCACNASADGLIRLKDAGVHDDVLSAISLHALRPNRALTLQVTLDFGGESTQARASTLYFFIDDGELTRVFTANLADLLPRKFAHETLVDNSDLLLPKRVRRVQLADTVPLKTYGRHNVLVAASANPGLVNPAQLSRAELAKAQRYTFDYPRSSLQSLCRLDARYQRDAVLTTQWLLMGSHFECEWN